MYEILEDGRVALDPTSPNDRIALSVYADLLRHDEDITDDFEKVLRPSISPGLFHIVKPTSKEGKKLILDYLALDDIELVKVVLRVLTSDDDVVESTGEQEKGVE